MGYRIDYDKGTSNFEIRKETPWRFPVLVTVCFGLFILLSSFLWPEGMEFIREIAIPGDNAVTVRAFEQLTNDLRSGASMTDAVTAFCREVIRNAQSMH